MKNSGGRSEGRVAAAARGTIKSLATHILVLGLVAQICSCGLLLHPERKGQTGGKIDPGIAVLDALGLLLFIVPGVVAFAVDFTYGTIYLPDTYGDVSDDPAEGGSYVAIKSGGKALTERDVELALREHLGKQVDLTDPGVERVPLDSLRALGLRPTSTSP